MKTAITIMCVILLVAAFGSLALAGHKPNGNSQQGGLPALAARVQKLESQVALLIPQVGSLQNALTALKNAVSALQSAVAGLGTAVANLQGQNNSAVVSAAGALVRHSGSASAAEKVGTGVYEVTFSKDVSGCAYIATIGDTANAAAGPGQISVSGDVDGDNPDDVQVQTFDKTGTAADSPFHLYVSCP